MNPSLFRPKRLVENSVEKIRPARAAATVVPPAKNAAPMRVLPINILFSTGYEQHPVLFGLKWSLPVRGLKAPQTGRVLHKD